MSSKCAHHLSDLVENRSFPWFLTIIDNWENIVIEKGRQDQERILPGEGGGMKGNWLASNSKIRKSESPTRLSSHTFHAQPLLPRICFLLLQLFDFTRPPPCSTSLFGLGADTQRLPECNTTLSCSHCSLSAAPKANHSTTGNDALIAPIDGPPSMHLTLRCMLKRHLQKTTAAGDQARHELRRPCLRRRHRVPSRDLVGAQARGTQRLHEAVKGPHHLPEAHRGASHLWNKKSKLDCPAGADADTCQAVGGQCQC